MSAARRWTWLALLALVLAGFGLRVYRADHHEIWGDEGAKLEVVNQGLARLFHPGAEVHPRFFHSWLYVWHGVFGYNAFGLRMLPVLFGTLGLPLIAVLARRLFRSRPAALAAVFVLALSPFHIAYSHDLTMYTLLFVMVTLSFYTLWRVAEMPRPGWRAWGVYALTTALMLHTHHYAFFALAAQNLFVLLRWRRLFFGRWLLVQALLAAATLPWLFIQARLLTGQAVEQWDDFTLANLGALLRQGALAFTVGATFPAQHAWIGWVFVALLLAALLALLRRPTMRGVGLFLGLWLLVPPLLVWVFDIWLQHFGERFISMSYPALALLLAWAIAHPAAVVAQRLRSAPRLLAERGRPVAAWPHMASVVLSVVLCAAYALTSSLALRGWYFDPAFLKSDYGQQMARIAALAQPGDILLLNGPQQAILFQIYQPAGLDFAFVSPDSVITPQAAERDFPALVAGYARAWLVLHGAPEVYDPDHRAEAWLSQNGSKAYYQDFLGGNMTLYALNRAADASRLEPLDVQFDNGPRLTGFAADPWVVRPGQTLFVTVRWQAETSMLVNYTVFNHLLAEDGQVAAQLDSQPLSGAHPTSAWQPGEEIVDNYALLIPETAVPGDYRLTIGLYDLASLQRLTTRAGLDHAFLGTIQVAP